MDNNSNINSPCVYSLELRLLVNSRYILSYYTELYPFRIVYSIIELHYNALASTICSFAFYIHLNLKFPLTK